MDTFTFKTSIGTLNVEFLHFEFQTFCLNLDKMFRSNDSSCCRTPDVSPQLISTKFGDPPGKPEVLTQVQPKPTKNNSFREAAVRAKSATSKVHKTQGAACVDVFYTML